MRVNNAKNYFVTHKNTVNTRIPISAKNALTTPEISYPNLFKGMINTNGGLGAKLERLEDGGKGVFGKPNKSNLFSSTDFPTIEGESTTTKSYVDGFMLISKVASQLGAYISNEAGAIEKLKEDVDALFLAHSMEDNNILLGISNDGQLEKAGIYGLANHPDIGRIDNTTGKEFKDLTASEIYSELKTQIYDFVKNVTPEESGRGLTVRKITMIFPVEIYLLIGMLEVTRGNETLNIFDALKKDMAIFGGIDFLSDPGVSKIKHLTAGNDTKCAIIGYFDPFFIEAKIPAPTNLLRGANGDASHIDKKTRFESLFVSKNLGLTLKNINIGVADDGTPLKYRVLRIIQGL